MNLTPIPLNLLNDTLEYCERLDTARGNEFKEPLLIKNVRVDFGLTKKKMYVSVNNKFEAVSFRGIVFVDYKNSIPFFIPKLYDRIVFNNEYFTVADLVILKPYDEIHHIEIYLK